ncbi:MAG: large-conductance mechanosensitive channel protein MscL [Mycobacterium sp.]|uniref:large-conductance mechanosensitive channel protein MscL n=1 Tax=Mycobacterium sp. TaxID=1785 RepID=UPI001ED48CD1|nr:large-conductance mechanosensitive channel protein MscL [Mycobacterium sp.]MBW0018301.1 large-conductance mechanosensitive channel protein MscL [Mycobacterium sp.]
MLKGFKEFLSRGNIVDLAVAVVIGTAFTALVKSFTDSIIQPLIERIGVKPDSHFNSLSIDIGGPKPIDLNLLLSAAIYFVLVAAVVYFFVVLPYNTFRKRGEVEQADDAQIVLLTEIRDLLAQTNGESSGKHVGSAPTPDHGPRAEAEEAQR